MKQGLRLKLFSGQEMVLVIHESTLTEVLDKSFGVGELVEELEDVIPHPGMSYEDQKQSFLGGQVWMLVMHGSALAGVLDNTSGGVVCDRKPLVVEIVGDTNGVEEHTIG